MKKCIAMTLVALFILVGCDSAREAYNEAILEQPARKASTGDEGPADLSTGAVAGIKGVFLGMTLDEFPYTSRGKLEDMSTYRGELSFNSVEVSARYWFNDEDVLWKIQVQEDLPEAECSRVIDRLQEAYGEPVNNVSTSLFGMDFEVHHWGANRDNLPFRNIETTNFSVEATIMDSGEWGAKSLALEYLYKSDAEVKEENKRIEETYEEVKAMFQEIYQLTMDKEWEAMDNEGIDREEWEREKQQEWDELWDGEDIDLQELIDMFMEAMKGLGEELFSAMEEMDWEEMLGDIMGE